MKFIALNLFLMTISIITVIFGDPAVSLFGYFSAFGFGLLALLAFIEKKSNETL